MLKDSKKILLAIETPEIAHILKYLLHSWGYNVISAADGIDAINLVVAEFPDLVVVDAALPKLDGLQVCRVIKEDFITAYIPIIVLIDKRQFRRNLLAIEQGIDDFLIKPPDPIDFEIRVALALRNAEHQFHANPLTKLPGNRAIERTVETAIKEGRIFSFAHVDINNFKSFNDRYGYLNGDKVIIHTAKMLSSAVKKLGNKNDFVGHIGGDDFVFMTTPDKEEIIAKEFIGEFDRLIPFHYNKIDREKGIITMIDRAGAISAFSLMTISVAMANNKNQTISSSVKLIEIIAEIKKYLKTLNKSCYLINRRSSDLGYDNRIKKDSHRASPSMVSRIHAKGKPLGQLLIDKNLINEGQLDEALMRHWKSGQRLGEVLVDMNFIKSDQLNTFLNDKH